jgi:2-isopropylmalate synthase
MVICGLARAKESDIERCFEAISAAKHHRIHTFLATSDIHLKYKLQMSREKCLQQIDKMVRFAKGM